MEAPEKGTTAEAVANYFASLQRPASAHYCVDNDSIIQCVQLKDIAYGAANANRNGIHIELAGYAKQTEAEWQDPYSKAMLLKAADLAASLCKQFGIPVVFRKASDLVTGRTNTSIRGFTTHAEVNKAFGGSHWDPGPSFPVEWFLGAVRKALEGQTVAPAGKPSLWLDGKQVPVPVELENGEALVSAKDLLELLGYDVTWEGINKRVIALKR